MFWSMTLRFDGSPPPPADVAGIDVRTLVPGQERQVYECSAAAFEDHWGDGFSSEQSWLHRHVHASDTFDPDLWFLAWEGEALVGVLLAAADPRRIPSSGTSAGWVCAARPAAAASARRCCAAAS